MSLISAPIAQTEKPLFNSTNKMWDNVAIGLETKNTENTNIQTPVNTVDQPKVENTPVENKPTETTPENVVKEPVVTPEVIQEVKVEKAPELKLSKEDQDHLDFLQDTKPANTSTQTTENVTESKETKKKELDPEVKSKLDEYERVLSNPMINAISEFIKSGGTDLNEFVAKTGIVDPTKLSVKDLYTKQAEGLGFTGDALEEAVAEQIAQYEGLSKISQKQIEKELRDKAKTDQAEKLKTFSTDSKAQNEEFYKIAQNANKQLDEKVESLTGKKWKGLLIDESLSKEIRSLASNYAIPIQDEKGRTIGYDTESAVDFAIWKASGNGRKLLKANYDMGVTKGKEEILKDRTRVSENPTSATMPSAKGPADNLDDAIKDKASSVGRTVSLSKGLKK